MSWARVRGPGHPDQVCDLVAAAVVDEYLRRDPTSRLNIRVMGGQGTIFLAGDVLSSADFDVSAVVQQTLGACGVAGHVEPFIAFEAVQPTWAPQPGAREPAHVFGYATSETSCLLPKSVAWAREAAQELERRRVSDADWFWLGSDFEVTVDDRGGKPTILVRAEHVESQEVSRVREEVERALRSRFADATIRINIAGEESRSGFASRMGSSGRGSAVDQYGSALPSMNSGAGLHLLHPQNVGAWMARSVARELVEAGKGRAVMVQLAWLPLEALPEISRIRNERGEDLTSHVDLTRFDLVHPPANFLTSTLVVDTIRAAFDGKMLIPWDSS